MDMTKPKVERRKRFTKRFSGHILKRKIKAAGYNFSSFHRELVLRTPGSMKPSRGLITQIVNGSYGSDSTNVGSRYVALFAEELNCKMEDFFVSSPK